ncbi:unnamed protein product [Nippostrongylus brasiliensis]|uniref:Secreted protein n=1 Tax=Nippostrongylus brasiliensis TaxID=27835 RepID=A0A0N4YAY0_NIPBR|nr:unnamed protein product [Nippostrongylus brasiliensis]
MRQWLIAPLILFQKDYKTLGACRLDDATSSILVQRGAVVQCSVLTVEYTAPLGRECSSKRILLKCTHNGEFDAQTAHRRVCKPLL